MKRTPILAIIATACAGLLYACMAARAQVITDIATWALPTQRVDGTALPVGEIAKTTIAWGTTPGGPYPNTQDVPAPGVTFTFTRSAPGSGTRCYTAFITDTEGRISGASNEACKTVKTAPKNPAGLAVQ